LAEGGSLARLLDESRRFVGSLADWRKVSFPARSRL
jgi:hypothetical protein